MLAKNTVPPIGLLSLHSVGSSFQKSGSIEVEGSSLFQMAAAFQNSASLQSKLMEEQ